MTDSLIREPERLRTGKQFEKRVREIWSPGSDVGLLIFGFQCNVSHKGKGARADIVITGPDDFRAVLEIKATDWDRIKPENVRRNLQRHERQLLRYIDKFLEADNVSVCPGLIYPSAPLRKGLREMIEEFLAERGIPAYWFDEIDEPETKT